MSHFIFLVLLATAAVATASHDDVPKFAYETTELTKEDIGNFTAIGPPANTNPGPLPECRVFPGTDDWPGDSEWQRLNASLGEGALLKPVPAAAVCYPGPYRDAAKCTSLASNQVVSKAYFDDPLALSTLWPAGNPCPVTVTAESPAGGCRQGGFPVYVVNATSVKQIQMAVNFARNKNLRLVVKNTGHDFVGRSTGAGALSIWTHHLKGFDLLPQHVQGAYHGDAAHAGVGLEAWEVHGAMAEHNVTLVAPSFATVGAFGGFMAGGGHSTLASYHGLASDQVLSLNAVTADGSFVTASPDINSDLFFALRGGGGGTYGIVTSAVVKTHPPVNVTTTTIAFSSLDTGTDLFWKAINTYFSLAGAIVEAGGIDRTYVTPLAVSSNGNATVFNFTSELDFPALTAQAVTATLLTSFTASLTAIGLGGKYAAFTPPTTSPWSAAVLGEGAPLRDERFASRLVPRAVYDNGTAFAAAMAALRGIVEEGGYQVHGTHMAPSLAVAGWPGSDSGVNPAFRGAVLHCVVYDSALSNGVDAKDDLEARARLNRYVNYLRRATPGSGAYINEADVLEPEWQGSFFGASYGKLVEVKGRWDPWGLFWAPATVGSEGWTVRTSDGEPTQDGRLCRSG